MAYLLIWSPISRNDLQDIVRFISRDSPARAQSFACRLIAETDRLQDLPEIGRVVPEHHQLELREIIFKPYRIVYRVDHHRRLVKIVRVWHAARGTPKMK